MKKIITILYLLIAVNLYSQDSTSYNDYKLYIIKKGSHYSNISNCPLYKSNQGEYIVNISFEKLPEKEWNFFSKLFGVSSAIPRLKSDRIGWRYVDSTCFELCYFKERNYKFQFIERTYIQAKKEKSGYYLSIPIILYNNRIGFLNKTFSFDKYLIPFMTDPYYGGDPKADQDYIIGLFKIDKK